MEISEKDLEVNNSSMYALEQDIVVYSRKLNIFGKMLALATTELSEAELGLEIISAELVTEIRRKEKLPPSVIQEIRRSMITKYPQYIEAKKKVIEKAEQKNIANSAYYSMTYKNDRIKEAFRLELKKLQPDSTFKKGESHADTQRYESYSESTDKKLRINVMETE